MAPSTAVHADVVLEPRDPAALEAFDTAVSTPGSPSFRHYLAPGEFAAVFGPTPTTVASVRGWLAGRGLARRPDVERRPRRPGLGHRGARSTTPSALGLEQYRLPSGRVVQAPDAEPLVPERAGP